MSLKNTIKTYLQTNGYMSLNDLEFLCKREGRKSSNGERRLRELMRTENITPIKKNGAIVAYEYQEQLKTCCASYEYFSRHATNCPIYHEMSKQAEMLEQHFQQELKLK